MKKILIFSLTYYPSYVGGAEVAIKEITDRIDSSDIEFHMVTLRFNKNLSKIEKIGNIIIHRIGFTADNPSMENLKKFPLYLNKFLYQFTAVCKACILHRKNRYDAIWGMMAHSTAVPAGLFKTLNPKIPYILTLQEGDPIEYIENKMKPLWPLFVRGFTKADIIQPISSFLASWAKDIGFSGLIEIIPNAVDTAYFSQEYTKTELNELEQELSKKSGDKFIITTSRLVKKNAIDDVIKALKYLPNNIKFLVLGIGPDLEMLQQLSKKEGVEDQVKFLGQVDHKEMPKYLKVSDIFIRPSLSEGFGNSFIEAMASGLPVIATQEGGISDFLFDPEKNPNKNPTGLAVQPRDPQGIAKQIKRLLEDKELTFKITKNARSMVFKKYDWDIISQNMREKIFARILK